MDNNREKRSRSSPITIQMKEIISNLFEFLLKVQRNEIDINSLISEVEIRKVIGGICQVSVKSVYRVLSEKLKSDLNKPLYTDGEDNDAIPHKIKVFSSPKKKGPKTKRKVDINDNQKDCIRHIIYDFPLTEHRNVTISGLKEKIKNSLNLSLGSTSLRALIRLLVSDGEKRKIIGRF